MAENSGGCPSIQQAQPLVNAQFDIFAWHVPYQSCVCYFVDKAQHSGPVQAVAAFVNIQLPFQRPVHRVLSSKPVGPPPPTSSPPGSRGGPGSSEMRERFLLDGSILPIPVSPQPLPYVTLLPYIRRLVATGFDFPGVLHSFFGDSWLAGVGHLHEMERRNYLFATKSSNWLNVKADYDLDADQTIPFLQPLQNVTEKEIVAAESKWSEWLAMQDWMVGPRVPSPLCQTDIKREHD